jgi:hypothetical protein
VHLDPLRWGERAPLVEDVGGDAIAPHVAEHRGQTHPGDLGSRQAELARGQLSEVADEPAPMWVVGVPSQLAALCTALVADQYETQEGSFSQVPSSPTMHSVVVAAHSVLSPASNVSRIERENARRIGRTRVSATPARLSPKRQRRYRCVTARLVHLPSRTIDDPVISGYAEDNRQQAMRLPHEESRDCRNRLCGRASCLRVVE